ncbi:MAG TPA: ROK family transcriptional regulator [Ktedonobacterales bacterium]
MTHTDKGVPPSLRWRDALVRPNVVGHRASDLHDMREANNTLVMRVIRQHGPLARVAIARRTGLSRTTVSSIVDGLLAEGVAREGETLSAAPSGGRRPTLVHFNESAGVILGVDFGRTHFLLLATDLHAHVLARRSGPCDTDLGPDILLPRLINEIRQLISDANLDWDRVVGVGVGIPGPVDAALNMLVKPPRMTGWDGVDVTGILREALGAPVLLNNDANLGALAEGRYGAALGASNFIYVKVGTGIGCGLVVDGKIYRGSSGVAGEFGHFTVVPDGPLCACGNRGCLEAVAGAPEIVRSALRAGYGQGEAAARATINGAGSLGALASTDADIDVSEVIEAALRGDPACQGAVRRAADVIGVALAGLVNLFNPSVITLYGSVARAGELLLGPIRDAIREHSLQAASQAVRVQTSALGDNAIAVGAATMIIDAVFGPPVAIAHVAEEAADV